MESRGSRWPPDLRGSAGSRRARGKTQSSWPPSLVRGKFLQRVSG